MQLCADFNFVYAVGVDQGTLATIYAVLDLNNNSLSALG